MTPFSMHTRDMKIIMKCRQEQFSNCFELQSVVLAHHTNVDDVMFSWYRRHRPESKTTRMFCPVK